MSAILGIFHHKGVPVDKTQLDHMLDAMAYWGPDGSGIWTNGFVGLGSLLCHNSPESHYEQLPYTASDGLVISAAARLDNRDELSRSLELEPFLSNTMPDSALILEAYRKWGPLDSLDHLLGDWAFALWDPGEQTLLLARDQHGNSGVYTYSNEHFFAFSSSVKGLLALPDVPRQLNEIRVVQRLVVWPGDGRQTFYTGIQRLPPAHALLIKNGDLQVHRYWRLEDTPELRLGSDEDYLDAFLEVYGRAVRDMLRCDRPVGVTLSGGLDSGSVTALAAATLAEEGKRLVAFGSTPKYESQNLVSSSRFADESPYMQSTAHFAGNVDLHFVRAEGVSPLEGIRRSLEIHDAPTHSASNQYWIVAILQAAQEMGLGALLTGQGGNATVSWRGILPPPVKRLLRGASLEDVRLDLKAFRQLHGYSAWQILRSRVIGPLLPPTFKSWWKGRGETNQHWTKHSMLNPALAQELELDERMRADGLAPLAIQKLDGRQLRLRMLRPDRSNIGALWLEAGAGFQLEVRDPTVERRLLEFCLAIPEEQYTRHGRERLLVRRAMQGRMPEEVLWNTKRGRQASDVALRLLEPESRKEIQELLDDLQSSPLAERFLDISRMQRLFNAIQQDLNPQTAVLADTGLLRGLSVGLFLRRFES